MNVNASGLYWPDAIICPDHGQVFFDKDEQKSFDKDWYCPRCKGKATYDWKNYVDYQDYLDKFLPRR